MRTRITRTTITKVAYTQESNMHIAMNGPVLSTDDVKIKKARRVLNMNQLCNVSSWAHVDDNNNVTITINPLDVYEHIKAHLKHKRDYAELTEQPIEQVDDEQGYILALLNLSLQVFFGRHTSILKSEVDRIHKFAEHIRFTYKALHREDAIQRAALAEVKQNNRIGWPSIQQQLLKQKTSAGDAEVVLSVAV